MPSTPSNNVLHGYLVYRYWHLFTSPKLLSVLVFKILLWYIN